MGLTLVSDNKLSSVTLYKGLHNEYLAKEPEMTVTPSLKVCIICIVNRNGSKYFKSVKKM